MVEGKGHGLGIRRSFSMGTRLPSTCLTWGDFFTVLSFSVHYSRKQIAKEINDQIIKWVGDDTKVI